MAHSATLEHVATTAVRRTLDLLEVAFEVDRARAWRALQAGLEAERPPAHAAGRTPGPLEARR